MGILLSPPDTFLTAQEIANFVGTTRDNVYKKAKSRRIPSIKEPSNKSINPNKTGRNISRKYPIGSVEYLLRERGTHRTLNKHINKCAKEIVPVCLYLERKGF